MTVLGQANHSGERCSSGKLCFASFEEAQKAARASRVNAHHEIASYLCDECGYHHHTKNVNGRSNALPPLRTKQTNMDRLARVVRMLHDADALAIDALLAYPRSSVAPALEACKLACAEAKPIKLELEAAGIDHPFRGSLAREMLDVLERVEQKRTALARLI